MKRIEMCRISLRRNRSADAPRCLRPSLALLLLSIALSGCFSFGPRTLKADQVDYARALGDAKKREILAMIVGLRYADAPVVTVPAN